MLLLLLWLLLLLLLKQKIQRELLDKSWCNSYSVCHSWLRPCRRGRASPGVVVSRLPPSSMMMMAPGFLLRLVVTWLTRVIQIGGNGCIAKRHLSFARPAFLRPPM